MWSTRFAISSGAIRPRDRAWATGTAEPSGYLGFYTNEQLLDYPGLTSTTVTESLNEDDEQLEQTYGAPTSWPALSLTGL